MEIPAILCTEYVAGSACITKSKDFINHNMLVLGNHTLMEKIF